MKKLSILFICLFLLNTFKVFSQNLVTDRPDQTESSVTIPAGSLQIETGFMLGYEEVDQISVRSIVVPASLFRLGIAKSIELRISSQFENYKIEDESVEGIGDIEVGAKVQLLKNENINTEIAFLSHLVVPSGTNKLSNGHAGTVNKLAISHSINDHTGLGYNIGYNYFGQGNGDLTFSTVLGYSINEKTAVFIEPFGEIANFEELVLNADAGFTWLLKNNFQLDFSFGTGLNHKMNYLSLGFCWRLLKE